MNSEKRVNDFDEFPINSNSLSSVYASQFLLASNIERKNTERKYSFSCEVLLVSVLSYFIKRE
jgi:hypothetical protein